MVVMNVLVHETSEMPFIQDNHVVEQVATTVADKTLCDAILPRALDTGSLGHNTEILDRVNDFRIEIAATVEDQILRSGVVGERVAQLLNHPRARRMFGCAAVYDSSPVMCDDEKAMEQAERERWHSEGIHRCDSLAMVTQKRCPSFGWFRISRHLSHPSQHSSLGDIEAKHLEFAMNARRSPCLILRNHSEDELALCRNHVEPEHIAVVALIVAWDAARFGNFFEES